MYFIMEVWRSRGSGITDESNDFPFFNFLTFFDLRFMKMRIQRLVPMAMIDGDIQTISGFFVFDLFYHPVPGSLNFGTFRGCKIDTLVKFGDFVNGMYPHTKSGHIVQTSV